MFDDFFPFTLFPILFAIIFILVISTIVIRIFKGRDSQQQVGTTVIKEREVIKEIVKIRCPYCSSLYDETEEKCPNCGANRA